MKVFTNDCSEKLTQFNTNNNNINKNQNSEAIEEALSKLIQHAVIYEEAKKNLKLIS